MAGVGYLNGNCEIDTIIWMHQDLFSHIKSTLTV